MQYGLLDYVVYLHISSYYIDDKIVYVYHNCKKLLMRSLKI